MEIKRFEKLARTLLKYGIGHNIEEAREKAQSLIEANRMAKKQKVE